MVQHLPATYPEIVSGLGAVETLPGIVKDGSWANVLLVCGKRSFETSGAARILDPLERVTGVERWSEFEPNTSVSDLFEGLQALLRTDPDLVVAVGGGSAMDLAKLMCGFDGTTDIETLQSAIGSGHRLAERRRGLILVPTTSGTGSEATHFSTVYVDQKKYSVAGDGLRPDTVILDPELSMSASAYQKATSGIDAVAQAIESLWAVAATPTSRRFARRALRYLMPNIEDFVNHGSTEDAAAMSMGSHLAGRAIDISRTTAAHALSYSLTQNHGVSHGHAVGLTLGALIEVHAGAAPEKLQPRLDPILHAQVVEDVLGYLGATSGADGGRRFRDLMSQLGLAVGLGAVDIDTPEALAEIAASVNPERLGNNPVIFNKRELLGLLEASR